MPPSAPVWLAYGFGGLAVCAAVLNRLITARPVLSSA